MGQRQLAVVSGLLRMREIGIGEKIGARRTGVERQHGVECTGGAINGDRTGDVVAQWIATQPSHIARGKFDERDVRVDSGRWRIANTGRGSERGSLRRELEAGELKRRGGRRSVAGS